MLGNLQALSYIPFMNLHSATQPLDLHLKPQSARRSLKCIIAASVIAAGLLAGCAGHQLSRGEARKILTNLPGLRLPKETIYVESVSQLDSSHAVAEANINTAFKLEKKDAEWIVTELRVDQGKWVRIDELYNRLLEYQIQRTQQDLNLIALGLERYRIYNARYADARNATQLMEILYPRFISRVVVEDAWARPLQYRLESPTRYAIISAGPDGKFGTDDDLLLAAGKD